MGTRLGRLVLALVFSACVMTQAGCQGEPAEPATQTNASFSLPVDQKMVVFGDAWAAGYDAKPRGKGFAYLLGPMVGARSTEVLADGGTGFVNAGRNGQGNYAARLAKLPIDPDARLVIVQGGLNDFAGSKSLFADAHKAISLAKNRFPNANIVVLGFVPKTLSKGATTMDRSISAAAEANSVHYISPIAERWITEGNIHQYIDPTTGHPNTSGHEFIARRLAGALNVLSIQ
ncbi:SGNH/GDSL hydrolase family protein [Gordonia alkanivorans]|uniref:SGNH/GDSL hydrolase family protein n=1 Tax=Gordonia alkanivorans TaxID=84096 RepID=UPI00244C9FC2|nr:SGNH/GDSL hydrolase family protein [Gordonia alkanivorans]MDH3009315.1 SGNH/GDSL hydrolase family protein [Gordonia alkanivorans]